MKKNNIVETSRELTARERLKFLDSAKATKLDEATEAGAFTLSPADYAIVERSDDSEDGETYNMIVILATDGEFYTSGSSSLIESFLTIFNTMKDEGEPYEIMVERKESKKRPGKYYLTCSIV